MDKSVSIPSQLTIVSTFPRNDWDRLSFCIKAGEVTFFNATYISFGKSCASQFTSIARIIQAN